MVKQEMSSPCSTGGISSLNCRDLRSLAGKRPLDLAATDRIARIGISDDRKSRVTSRLRWVTAAEILASLAVNLDSHHGCRGDVGPHLPLPITTISSGIHNLLMTRLSYRVCLQPWIPQLVNM
jgi:hypothetical protein